MCCWSLSWLCPIDHIKLPSSHSWHVVLSSDTIIPCVIGLIFPHEHGCTSVCLHDHIVFLPGTEDSVQLPTWGCPVLFQMTQRVWVRLWRSLGVPVESCARENVSPIWWSISGGNEPWIEEGLSAILSHTFSLLSWITLNLQQSLPCHSLLYSDYLWISTEMWRCISDFLSLWTLTIYLGF